MPVFETVIKMNIAASLTAATVLAVKYILERLGLPRRVLFLLWLVIAFRLVCPTAPQSRLSVMNLFTSETAVEQSAEYADKTDETGAAVGSGKTPLLPDVIAVIWLCGTAAMLVCGAVSYARLKRRLRFAAKYSGNVYFADDIPTAFVLGVLRPKIYVPSGTARLEYVIAHERTHIRRLDHISKLFAYALLSVNWFNPVIWLLFRLFSGDMELACDECVTARFDASKRKEYMNALLDAAIGKNGMKIPYHVCFSESITKRRIEAVLNVKNLSIPVMAAAVVCCVTAGAVFGTSAVTAQQHSAEPYTDTSHAAYATPKPDYTPPETEPSDNDNENPADKSVKMPAVPYTEPLPDNAGISAATATGEDTGGETIPAMRMPDGASNMPAPAGQGIVPVESEPENAEPENTENDGGTTGVYTTGSVSRDDVTGIEMGTRREDVYSALGVGSEPYSSSAREEYSLDDGGTAVLIFDENNQLTRGYIAEN